VKTISLKKVAAVAVASLGFGLLSVVPANAEIVTGDVVVTETVSTAIGTASPASNIQISSDAAIADNATTVTMTVALTSKPSGSSVVYSDKDGSGAGTAAIFVVGSTAFDAASDSSGTYTLTKNVAITGATANMLAGTVSLTPDVGGVYVVTVCARTLTNAGNADCETYTVYAGYSVDAAKPNTAFMTQGASINNSASAVAGGVATVRVTNFADTATADFYNVTVSGGTLSSVSVSTNIDKDAADTAGFNLANGANLAGGINFYTDGDATVSDWVNLQVTSATAGNVTITVTGFSSVTGIGTVHSTPVVVFGAAASTSATAAKSTIYAVATHNTQATSSSAALVPVARAAGTDAAAFSLVVNDGYGNPLDATIVSATVTGPGLIIGGAGTNGNTTPNARVATATTNASGQVFFNLDADGTAGTSTITFAVGTTTLGTQTVQFYGAAAKYTATVIANAVAGTATQDVVNVSAVDAAGIAIPTSTIYAFSSDATVASVETSDTTASTAVTSETSPGVPGSFVSIKPIGTAGFTVTPAAATTASSVTITFGNAATLAASTVTTTAVVGIGGVEAASVVLTTNKTTYAPGEKMTVTLTFRDALGRLTGTNIGSTVVGAFTSSTALSGDALWTAGAAITKLGVATKTVYAPLGAGPVTISGETGTDGTYLATSQRAKAVSVTATVSQSSDISAIATQIDALNAKIVALNALIAKIMKKLGVR
jgi:hypothetical protein